MGGPAKSVQRPVLDGIGLDQGGIGSGPVVPPPRTVLLPATLQIKPKKKLHTLVNHIKAKLRTLMMNINYVLGRRVGPALTSIFPPLVSN